MTAGQAWAREDGGLWLRFQVETVAYGGGQPQHLLGGPGLGRSMPWLWL